MDVNLYKGAFHRPLVAFIEEAVNLKELRLRVSAACSYWMNFEYPAANGALVKAISSNTNLDCVVLDGVNFPSSDCKVLAEAAVSGPHLNDLKLRCESSDVFFLRHMAPVAESSYSIFRLEVWYHNEAEEEYRTVKQVTIRNSGLVIRAARFVMGDETSYCARALELVSGHPKLVEMLQHRAAASCDEVKEMIRGALCRIAGMNQFMRAAGVIKETVECCVGRDRETQLDELNEYCWMHIRIYLKVADILDPPLARI
ncbi:hypothetical protein V5799_032162 [Amblyomma americanum]|uniref:Uncharacterized protein n=1 Tax=Amblyomma americanum TaxID=6943 RepID=A0AAQ4DRY9_AMBAM